jgi:two-component system OmpR family response regulator/two-component system copper resistance phosphate regulon response regulator CusR
MDLLVIEDDRVTGQSLQRGFEEAGHHCVWVKDGRSGVQHALSQRFDALILDLLLPEKPGLEVLREIRAKGIRSPVLLLTALGSVEERVAGLEAGADDYVVKPFAFAEILARLEAIRRRVQERPPAVLGAAGLQLDLTTRRVMRDGKEVDLTPTEFSILEMLLRHAGQVVTRKMLCEQLWEADWEGTTNVIEVHITRLRQKLGGEGPSPIQTVRGRGYVIRAA